MTKTTPLESFSAKTKKDTMVEITLPENNNQIFASMYKLVLPGKAELKKPIEEYARVGCVS